MKNSARLFAYSFTFGLLSLSGLSNVSGQAATNTIPWPPTGPIGIGTTNPLQKLHVKGNLRLEGLSGFTHSDLEFYRADGAKYATIGQGDLAVSNSTFDIQHFNGNDIRFLNNGVEQVRIVATSGNVGIGLANPLQKLQIKGNFRLDGVSGFAHSDMEFYRADGVKFATIGQGDLTAANSTFDIQHLNGNDIRFLNNGAEQLRIKATTGYVGIGTNAPDAKLAVNGQVHALEVKVSPNVPGPDYVFEKDYNLPTLKEIKAYIDQNRHLPGVPSADDMEKNGVLLGEMNLILLKKVEELTLYVIEQKEQLEKQNALIEELNKKK